MLKWRIHIDHAENFPVEVHGSIAGGNPRGVGLQHVVLQTILNGHTCFFRNNLLGRPRSKYGDDVLLGSEVVLFLLPACLVFYLFVVTPDRMSAWSCDILTP